MKKIFLLALLGYTICTYAIELNSIKQMDVPFNAFGGLKLDSIIYQSEKDISYCSKYAFQYTADGRISMKSTYNGYDAENNMWVGSNRDEYTFLPEGSVIYYNYTWNDISHDWKMNRQVDDLYDDKGHNVSTVYYTWDTSTGLPMLSNKKEYEYYDNTDLIYIMSEAQWSNNSWENTKRTLYTYDENDNISGIYSQKWEKSSWSLESKIQQAYNEQNQLVSKEFLQWDNANLGWDKLAKYDYIYVLSGSAFGKISTETQWIWYKASNSYIGNQRNVSTYNTNGFLIKNEAQEFKDLSRWKTYYTETFERDDKGNLLSYTSGLESTGPDMHYEYTYDAKNNWVTYSDFEWDETNSTWILSSLDSLSYDAFGNVQTRKSYDNNMELKSTQTYYYQPSNYSPLEIDFDYTYTWNVTFPDEWYNGDSIGVITRINNNSSEPFAGVIMLQFVNSEDENIKQELATLDLSEDAIEPLNYKFVRFNGKIKVPAGNYIQTVLCRNNYQEEWVVIGATEGHENPTTFVVSAREESTRYVILAQRSTSSNWFYMTSDLGTASNKRYQAVDAGTNIIANVSSTGLDDKYYWEIEGNKLKNGSQYSTWVSGNTAIFDATGKDLTIQQQSDGTYTFSFTDGTDTRYLALNSIVGNNYFAYYTGSSPIRNLVLLPYSEEPIPPARDCKDIPYTETFASSQGEFTIQNVTLPSGFTSIWNWDSRYGMVAKCIKGSTKYESESYLISPCIELPENAPCILTFSHAAKFFQSTDQMSLWISTNYNDSDPESAQWNKLVIPNYPTGANWNWYESGDIDLSAYSGQGVNIAFCYTSTTSYAPQWEIKNFAVNPSTATLIESVQPTQSSATKVLRNGQLFILRDGKTYTVQGQEVR